MANVLELILNAVDNTSKTLQNIQANGANLEKQLTANWKAIGLAAAAAGAGLEVLARKQGELAEQTSKVSIATGLTEQELNELARSVAGAGDSIGETLTVMQTGAEQGLKSAEALEEYASYWDLVGDASGENSEALAAAAVSLESFGISAENISDSADAFGYVLNNTTLSLGEFEGICSRVGPSVSDLGLSIDDMAIIMDSLEERGITGKKAISAITDAAKAADGDINKFASALGISTTALSTAEQATDGYAMKLDDMATAHDENITAIEKMSSYLGELQYKYGDLIVQASALAPALMAVGPAIKVFDVLTTSVAAAGGVIPLLTTSLVGVGAAILPLLPLIAGLAAAVAVAYVAWKTNFLGIRDITAQAGDFIKDRVSTIKDTLSDLGEAVAPSIDKLKSAFGNLFTSLDNLFKKFTGGVGIIEAVGKAFEFLGKAADVVIRAFGGALITVITAVADGLSKLADFASRVVDWFTKLASNPLVSFFADLARAAFNVGSAFLDSLLPAAENTNTALESQQGTVQTVSEAYDEFGNTVTTTAQSVSSATGSMASSVASSSSQMVNSVNGIAVAYQNMIASIQSFVRDATGAWQGLQEITTITGENGGGVNYWYNESTGIWEQMVPAADGQGYVPIGSPNAATGTGSSSTTTGTGSSSTTTADDSYTIGDNKYDPTPEIEGDWTEDPDYTGFINTGSYSGGIPSPHGHNTSTEQPLYITQQTGANGKVYNQAYYADASQDNAVWGVNISPEDIAQWIGEGVALYEYDPSNYMGGYQGDLITDAVQDQTDALETMADQTETLTSTTYDWMDATDSATSALDTAASAQDGYSSSLYDTSGASDIAASASDGLTGSLYRTATAAGKSLAAMDTMGAGMVTGMESTSNSVLGTFAAMGAGAAQSTGYISDICANLFGSIQNKAIAAMSAISGSSCADGSCGTLSTSTGGAGSPILTDGTSRTGLNCGGILPGSGIYDMGESWTTGSGSFTTTTAYDYTSSSLFDGILNPFLASLYPAMAEGGDVTRGGFALVGERGPEFLNLPAGATVTPLNNHGNPMAHIEEIIARHEQEREQHQQEWAAKIVDRVVSKLGGRGGGGDVHLHGVFIADKSGLMKLQKELENVKILEDTRRGRKVTA